LLSSKTGAVINHLICRINNSKKYNLFCFQSFCGQWWEGQVIRSLGKNIKRWKHCKE